MSDFDLQMLSLRMPTPSQKTDEIVLSFFISFAMFENQLIRAGFFSEKKGGFVEVSWEKFCLVILNEFPTLAMGLVEQHRVFLQDEPPGKFFWDRETQQFEWRLSESDKRNWSARRKSLSANDFKEMTVLLRRIRNNLFHGHKAMDSEHQIRERMSDGLKIVQSLRSAVESRDISNF